MKAVILRCPGARLRERERERERESFLKRKKEFIIFEMIDQYSSILFPIFVYIIPYMYYVKTNFTETMWYHRISWTSGILLHGTVH